jgi:hypothetical protein
MSYEYEVCGEIISGSYPDKNDVISLPEQVKSGDVFCANSHWYEVVIAGLNSDQEDGIPARIMIAKKIGNHLAILALKQLP